jgi:hypothetical protein
MLNTQANNKSEYQINRFKFLLTIVHIKMHDFITSESKIIYC